MRGSVYPSRRFGPGVSFPTGWVVRWIQKHCQGAAGLGLPRRCRPRTGKGHLAGRPLCPPPRVEPEVTALALGQLARFPSGRTAPDHGSGAPRGRRRPVRTAADAGVRPSRLGTLLRQHARSAWPSSRPAPAPTASPPPARNNGRQPADTDLGCLPCRGSPGASGRECRRFALMSRAVHDHCTHLLRTSPFDLWVGFETCSGSKDSPRPAPCSSVSSRTAAITSSGRSSPKTDVSTASASSMTGTLRTERARPPSGTGPTSPTPGRRLLSKTRSRRPSSGPLRRGARTSRLGTSVDRCHTPGEGAAPPRLRVSPHGLETRFWRTFREGAQRGSAL